MKEELLRVINDLSYDEVFQISSGLTISKQKTKMVCGAIMNLLTGRPNTFLAFLQAEEDLLNKNPGDLVIVKVDGKKDVYAVVKENSNSVSNLSDTLASKVLDALEMDSDKIAAILSNYSAHSILECVVAALLQNSYIPTVTTRLLKLLAMQKTDNQFELADWAAKEKK